MPQRFSSTKNDGSGGRSFVGDRGFKLFRFQTVVLGYVLRLFSGIDSADDGRRANALSCQDRPTERDFRVDHDQLRRMPQRIDVIGRRWERLDRLAVLRVALNSNASRTAGIFIL
jgi:hypothetical protein